MFVEEFAASFSCKITSDTRETAEPMSISTLTGFPSSSGETEYPKLTAHILWLHQMSYCPQMSFGLMNGVSLF